MSVLSTFDDTKEPPPTPHSLYRFRNQLVTQGNSGPPGRAEPPALYHFRPLPRKAAYRLQQWTGQACRLLGKENVTAAGVTTPDVMAHGVSHSGESPPAWQRECLGHRLQI